MRAFRVGYGGGEGNSHDRAKSIKLVSKEFLRLMGLEGKSDVCAALMDDCQSLTDLIRCAGTSLVKRAFAYVQQTPLYSYSPPSRPKLITCIDSSAREREPQSMDMQRKPVVVLRQGFVGERRHAPFRTFYMSLASLYERIPSQLYTTLLQ